MHDILHPSSQLTLVTGPSRSGKSEWAEFLADRSAKKVVYVATAQTNLDDQEWQARIEQHRLRRPSHWATLEGPIDLAATIRTFSADHCLLVDSLGTWLANLLEQDEATWWQTQATLLTGLRQRTCEVILVAEEAGWGLVPAYPVGRLFRDRLGLLVRQIGTIADPVYLVTAGHVLNLSRLGMPLGMEGNGGMGC
ncbi:bifunctional adenosylcobinamide kinase/adenosylcobinamide-phosphate guanylyltransferase [Leptolyngbya sp. 'hensonii']|uniref:bifunctional adenosylcobinamide kinase/adenosylcobinamide-phosphate guanylyltransferase n=1 Tax=Leptolyngbya sp. 'hensonii' TaxID=1922337 RepID=UPI00094F57B4|nr:bifunctional adenosylcobinamide kinase/adenosylcobinamide-phosphate guanylyltransferase [Leptolyngbya sp. 'hensonii']OLP19569.1 bifunctional adenosylcobinamide kinase/adenosylcobinamide-phosphate guanylyltransferase [Leptolyngbya sp. 'hensonii']